MNEKFELLAIEFFPENKSYPNTVLLPIILLSSCEETACCMLALLMLLVLLNIAVELDTVSPLDDDGC